MGDVIVLVVLGIIVALVIHSIWKSHKNGGHCSGCSGNCSQCGCHTNSK